MTVAREIELSDPFKNMGAMLVREVASKTSELTGPPGGDEGRGAQLALDA